MGVDTKTGLLSEAAMRALQEAIIGGFQAMPNGSSLSEETPRWMFRDVKGVPGSASGPRLQLQVKGKFWYRAGDTDMCLRTEAVVTVRRGRKMVNVLSVKGAVRSAYRETDVLFSIEQSSG